MDRGIPTEEVLAEMRAADPPVRYLVGTPKGRLTRLERDLLELALAGGAAGSAVKLLPQDGELYVLAQSHDRVGQGTRHAPAATQMVVGPACKDLAAMKLTRDELLMKLGAARSQRPDRLGA